MANGWKVGMAGTFFPDKKDRGGARHLYVVISDPQKNANEVALVNVTSMWQGVPYDKSCTFTGGEHRHIWKPSYVRYDAARVVSVAELTSLVKADLLHPSTPVTPVVLRKIQEGALRSDRTPIRIRELLKEQGLV